MIFNFFECRNRMGKENFISIDNVFFIILLFTLSIVLFSNPLFGQSKSDENAPPNVLFIAIDDLNDWTGFLGGHPQAKTPNLDKLAESAVTFMNAHASAPICGPSRTSLMYGKYPHKTGSYGHHQTYNPKKLSVFDSLKTMPTVFRENGYYTAGAGKLFHYQGDQKDFETYFNPSVATLPDPNNKESFYPDSSVRPPLSSWRMGPLAPEDVGKDRDRRISDWAIEQLKSEHEKPFFIGVGFHRPHLPWSAPQQYFDKFDLKDVQLPPGVWDRDLEDIPQAGRIFSQSLYGLYLMNDKSDHEFMTEQPMRWEHFVRAYLATTTYVDALVGEVLEELKASRYADNTIVVLWGDHGWHLGEKESWRKMTLWERGTKTPLIFYIPGNSSNGSKVKQPVSLQDIYPTLVELIDIDVEQELDGNSLLPLINNPNIEWEKPILISNGPGNFAVGSGEWRYIRYQNGDEELYNRSIDRYEFYNLVNNNKYDKIVERLSKSIPDKSVRLYGPRFKIFENLNNFSNEN